MNTPMFLRLGDEVLWSGAWGSESWQRAQVDRIELTLHKNSPGKELDALAWWRVTQGAEATGPLVIVGLTNGHWAYGYQLRQIDPGAEPETPRRSQRQRLKAARRFSG